VSIIEGIGISGVPGSSSLSQESPDAQFPPTGIFVIIS
jgi:hypothetical protein